jgi:hypothetical protein
LRKNAFLQWLKGSGMFEILQQHALKTRHPTTAMRRQQEQQQCSNNNSKNSSCGEALQYILGLCVVVGDAH